MSNQLTTGVFDVNNMNEKLNEYLPQGETIIASVSAISKERIVKAAYDKCVVLDRFITPTPDGDTVYLSKEKHCTCDIYFGITENGFIIVDALPVKHAYFYGDRNFAEPEKLAEPIHDGDIGNVFRFEDIDGVQIKKGIFGAMNVNIIMKNQSRFKLMFPKRAGMTGKAMPNHVEYREKILARLGTFNGIDSNKKTLYK